MIFNIEKNPYDEIKIFKKKKLELKPNSVTCFIGCNGSGKTTLIREIKDQLYETAKEIKEDFYSNQFNKIENILNDNYKEKEYDTYYIDFDKSSDTTNSADDYITNAFGISFSSTGEGIIARFGRQLQVIGNFIRKIKNKKVFIFLDDCDAGTSIDMIEDIKGVINYIINDCEKNNLEYYIILTANSYELCKDYNCLSVHDFSYKTFKSYNSYKKFILKSRKLKEIREKEVE